MGKKISVHIEKENKKRGRDGKPIETVLKKDDKKGKMEVVKVMMTEKEAKKAISEYMVKVYFEFVYKYC